VPEVFRAIDAFALPSMFEPFGNVVMEAMASGIGALASAQCGVAELMPPLLQHLVVEDPAHSGEIAKRLDALLQSGREVGEAARAAAARYTWERYANGLLALISSLV
jgi:glycosyltransferase involved in cell wall biosynthesis